MPEIDRPGSLSAHRRVLQELRRGAPLSEVLETIVEESERIVPEMRSSVLLVTDGRLHPAAGSRLPEAFRQAVDGLPIGPRVGSCGAAAATARRVVVADVRTHPNWAPFLEQAERAEIRASWSEPILAADGTVLATFAMYYREPREPSPFELELIETMAQVAGVALESDRARKRLGLLERQLRQIIDLDPNLLFVKDARGRLVLVNEALARAYGTTVAALTGAPHADHHAEPAELARMLGEDREVILSGRPKVIAEESFQDARGRRRILHTTKIPFTLLGDDGLETPAVLGVSVDVTERKRIEQSLRESEERFRQISEAIREVFWLTDWQNNEVLYVSPAYETVWGRSCESLYADPRSWSEDIHPDDRERVFEQFRTEAALGTYETEYRLVRPDGVRWIYDRAFPIRDAAGQVYRVAGISEDVTARKETELELERALAELDARSRERVRSLEADLLLAEERERRRLAVDLHDGLNQLLTLAQMKLAGLRDAAAGGEMRAGLAEVEKIVGEADRAARTLTFQLSPPVLHDLGFEAAVAWLAEDVQEAYELGVDLLPHEPLGQLDEDVAVLLFRAVRELLINVAKHAGAGAARVRMERSGHAVKVLVEDDGVAFDPSEVGGRGVGLSSIRERLEALGGSMTIRSEAGRGTAIALVAPVHAREPRA